jgi:hypothetical protein
VPTPPGLQAEIVFLLIVRKGGIDFAEPALRQLDGLQHREGLAGAAQHGPNERYLFVA